MSAQHVLTECCLLAENGNTCDCSGECVNEYSAKRVVAVEYEQACTGGGDTAALVGAGALREGSVGSHPINLRSIRLPIAAQ